MILSGTRFGELQIDDAKMVSFARGLVGFPEAHRFVLLAPPPGRSIAWLQSVDRPELAFPVMPATEFGDYPRVSPRDLAREANLGGGDGDVAILVVVAVGARRTLVANLLAPIVVDLATCAGAQVLLDPRRYSARAPVAHRAASDPVVRIAPPRHRRDGSAAV